MKEALLKKRYGLPAALLLVLLLALLSSGTALAWYSFATNKSKTTVQEPLSTTETTEFSAIMYPGQTNTWTWDIVNSADVAYDIKADLILSAPNGVSITKFIVAGVDETGDLLNDKSATFSIPVKSTLPCSMTITAAGNAKPGVVSVSLDLSREK